jgi:hypothetical protein
VLAPRVDEELHPHRGGVGVATTVAIGLCLRAQVEWNEAVADADTSV